jgi:uncharacterized membrane protein
MSTPTSLARHPLHPILVALPIGLWVFSVVADLVFQLRWGAAVWKDVAFYTLGGGIVGALLAAVPGFIDFFSITDARAGRVALTHMAANLIALTIFVVSFWLRWIDVVGFLPAGLSIVALGALAVAGWYGGELVFVHGMGVKPPRQSSSERRGSSTHRRIA